MLKIIEKVEPGPIRFPAKPGVNLQAGCIGRVVDYEGVQVVDLSDGYGVFGVIGNKRMMNYISFDREDLVSIWPQRMVFKTSQYDRESIIKYIGGQSLYVNRKGLLTPQKPREDCLCIAKLTKVPGKGSLNYIEALWL